MSTKKFKDIFLFGPKSKIKAGDGLDEGLFPFYTSSSILKKYVNTEQHFDEALIFGTGGSASIHYSNESFSTSTDCIVAITTDKNYNTKFVYYYLYRNLHILERGFKGAGLKHISKKYIQNIDIPAFEIEIQNKIVAILDKSSHLIVENEKTLDEIDKLITSYFKNCFGDSLHNPKNYELVSISNLSNKIIDCPHSTPKYVDNATEFPCIRTTEIKNGQISWSTMKYLNQASYEKRIERHVPVEGDVIFAREGTVGDAAIVPKDSKISLGQRVMLFSLDRNTVTPEYFWSLIRSDGIQHIIKSKIIGATVKRININEIKKIECPIPPIDLQMNYSSIVRSILNLKENKINLLEESRLLLNSISQKAFSGKLNFDISLELDALLEEIVLQKAANDLISIVTNEEYLLNLVERLNNQEFENQDLYDKAKHAAFQLLKDEERLAQEYDEQTKSLKLVVK